MKSDFTHMILVILDFEIGFQDDIIFIDGCIVYGLEPDAEDGFRVIFHSLKFDGRFCKSNFAPCNTFVG